MNLVLAVGLAGRSVLAHGRQVLVAAVILGMNACIIVVGWATLSSASSNLEHTLISTVVGDLHVFPPTEIIDILQGEVAQDRMALLDDAAAVEARLEADPNVAEVVPMAMGDVGLRVGNRMNRILGRAREALRRKDLGALSQTLPAVRTLAARLSEEIGELAPASNPLKQAARAKALRDLAYAETPELTARWDADPETTLEFMENHLAALAGEGSRSATRMLAAPPRDFARAFNRFEIVSGALFEGGSHGFMVTDVMYERMFKHPLVTEFDELHRQADGRSGGLPPGVVGARAERLMDGAAGLLRVVLPGAGDDLRRELRDRLGQPTAELPALLQAFFELTPENLDRRYREFYEVIAPRLELYSLALGDHISIESMGAHGYPTVTDAVLTGTYRFKGAEGIPNFGTILFADPTVAAALLGFPDADLASEISGMQHDADLRPLDASNADQALFGDPGGATTQGALSAGIAVEIQAYQPTATVPRFQHAALFLRDPKRVTASLLELRQRFPDLRFHPWNEAVPRTSALVRLASLQLWVGLAVALLIAVLIVNVIMLIVTTQRRKELATLRAIGAGPMDVVVVILTEAGILGFGAAIVGAGAGAAVAAWLSRLAFTANDASLAILYGGGPLRPETSLGQQVATVVIVTLVGTLGAVYPAFLATRIPPVAAMREGAPMNGLLSLAVTNLRRGGLRTLFVAVILATVSLINVGTRALFDGVVDRIVSQGQGTSSGDLNVHGFVRDLEGPASLVIEDQAALTARLKTFRPGTEVVVRQVGYVTASNGTRSTPLDLQGIYPEQEQRLWAALSFQGLRTDGGPRAAPGTIILYAGHAAELGVDIGGEVRLWGRTDTGVANSLKVKVSGIVDGLVPLGEKLAFADHETVRLFFDRPAGSTSLAMLYVPGMTAERSPALVAPLIAFLREADSVIPYQPVPNDRVRRSVARSDWRGKRYAVNSAPDALQSIWWRRQAVAAITTVLVVILVGMALLGAANAMVVSVDQRQRELGTLRALGLSRPRLMALLVIEGFLLGLAGAMVGGALGSGLCGVLNLLRLPLRWDAFRDVYLSNYLSFTVHSGSLLLTVLGLSLTTGFVSLFPALRAARRPPAFALRQVS